MQRFLEKTIMDTLEPIRNAEDDFKAGVEASVQSGAEDLVGNTVTRLNTLIQEEKVTDRDLEGISSGLGEATSRMVKNRVPVTHWLPIPWHRISSNWESIP